VGDADTAFTISLVGVGAVVYFLPALIAVRRDHENDSAIILLNLLLGWTVVGWVVALVWAVLADQERTDRPRQYGHPRRR
jgi:threonine/homoserine/homoserine lactone efflux protein